MVSLPFPYLGIGCMLIPVFGGDEYMQPAVAVNWVAMSLCVMLPSIVYYTGGRSLSKQLDETIAATQHLQSPTPHTQAPTTAAVAT